MGSLGKRIIILLFILVMTVGLLACGEDNGEEEGASNIEEDQTEENATNSESDFPVTITDDTGEEVVIEEEPERLITVIPSATEIAFGLDLGDKVVGVTDNDTYPEEVQEIESVGAFELNIEKILSLEPDLILADVTNGEAIQQLREQGLKVVVLGANNLTETYDDILTVGKATGTTGAAEDVVASMKEEVEAVEAAIQQIPEDEQKTVWIEIGEELFTAGSGTFLNELVERAGGQNIMVDQEGWPQVSEEAVIEANPDVILVTYASYVENAVEKVKSRDAWQDITAIKHDQVYPLDSDLTERPGPRITQGLEMIASYLYPEAFEEQ